MIGFIRSLFAPATPEQLRAKLKSVRIELEAYEYVIQHAVSIPYDVFEKTIYLRKKEERLLRKLEELQKLLEKEG